MITPEKTQAIRDFFRLLEGAGYQRPDTWRRGDPNIQRDKLERAVQLWGALTMDQTPEVFLAAGLAWVRQDRFRKWPVPGQIVSMAESLLRDLDIDGDSAWGLLKRLISAGVARGGPLCTNQADFEKETRAWEEAGNRYSCWTSPPPILLHENPVVAVGLKAGIDALGGPRGLSRMTNDSEVADRASFRAAFNAHRGRGAAQRLALSSHDAMQAGQKVGLLPAPQPNYATGEESIREHDAELLEAWRGEDR